MESFKKHIANIEQSDWDYYSNVEYKELKNPFTSKLSHISFVNKYFKRSGKSKILDFKKFLPNRKLNNNRIKHTNSIFFLGILIYKRTSLKSDFFEGLNTAEYKRFPFLWFLTCLFHDFGFDIEEQENATKGINDIKDLKERYSIQNCLLETNPIETNKILFSSIENYFLLRLKKSKKIDHGIWAGLYLYDKLLKIRREKINEHSETLFWGQELEEQYARVSSAIATHNIWLPTEESYESYKKYNLENLISEFSPITFRNSPLLYILGIVDTIDPIKTYMRDGFKPDYILRNIEFEFKGNSIRISNNSKSKLDFKKMIKNVSNLEGWIKINCENTETEIKFTIE